MPLMGQASERNYTRTLATKTELLWQTNAPQLGVPAQVMSVRIQHLPSYVRFSGRSTHENKGCGILWVDRCHPSSYEDRTAGQSHHGPGFEWKQVRRPPAAQLNKHFFIEYTHYTQKQC